MIDRRAALEKVIRHAVELEDDYLNIAPIVDALASSGDVTLVPDLAAALDRFLDEENFYGRDLIAAVLAGIQGTAALPELLRASARDLGDDQDSLQSEIVEVLHVDPAGCRPIVLAFIASDDAALRSVGLWALGFVTEPGDVTVLAAAATDPDPTIRSMAVGSVGDPDHDDEAFGVLIRALSDTDEQVRASAVNRLGFTGRADAVAPVADVATDPAPGVRLMVAYALGRLASTESAPVLLRLLDDPDLSVRERAVEALGRIGGAVAVDALLALAVDPDPAQRVQAAQALPNTAGSDPRVTEQVLALARDNEPAVRAATVSGLIIAAHGTSTWAPLVAEMANDPDPMVRQRVAVAARRLTPDTAADILHQYATDPDPTVRRIAAAELDRVTRDQQ